MSSSMSALMELSMEEAICSAEEVLRSERRNRKALGAMADLPLYTIPYPQIRKIAALKNHIFLGGGVRERGIKYSEDGR
ncbi:MAG: hypothetical protein NC314_06280 [Roseburia sp.]|nr:hypothetical protein [Roseburia sp.]